MSAPHFFVEAIDAAGTVVELSPEDSRHALRSLRLRPGEPVTVADGRGLAARGRIAESQRDMAAVILDEVDQVERPAPRVSVAIAPPKGDRLAWAVQKLAEVGVDEVVLFESERSVRTLAAERAGKTLSRLRAIAREASMQSRRAFLTEISGPESLQSVLRLGSGRAIVLWEEAERSLAEVMKPEPSAVRVVVGPEGGFGSRDLSAVREAEAPLASLGPGILRTETAAVVAAAVVLARVGRLG